MRELANFDRIHQLIRRFGEEKTARGRVYFTGGTTAVLLGWRASTIDVDLKLEPGAEPLLRAVPAIKEELQINVELASPPDFIPPLPGWEERSLFICQSGNLSFYHFDPYSQLLAKIERAHAMDLTDVKAWMETGLVAAERALAFYRAIEPELYRYPAIDPKSFRKRVETILAGGSVS